LSENLKAKELVVEEIKTKIQASKSVVIINFSGLTVNEDTAFRNEFRKIGAEYKVLKNTLIRKAFDELGVKDFDNHLNGPTAVAFGKDETSAAKVINDAIKTTNEKISVKSAYVDGKYVDEKGVKELATIPSKEVLYAQLAGSLSGIIRSLAVALNKVAEQKGQANA